MDPAPVNGSTLARVEPLSLARPVRQLEFSAEQRQIIRDTFANGASDEEFAVLMEVAKARNLNPLTRQIFFVKRWDSQKQREVWQPQVSIDGLRAIAERTGRYEGQTASLWCGRDGVWKDVWLAQEPPAAAKAAVLKAGCREPFVAVARWGSYVQTKKGGEPTAMWARMADVMLAKCAESLALRKAFPEDASGLYTPEEMGQSENPVKEHPALPARRTDAVDVESRPVMPAAPAKASAADLARRARAARLWQAAKDDGMDAETWKAWTTRILGAAKPNARWTDADLDKLEADQRAATEGPLSPGHDPDSMDGSESGAEG